MSRSFLVPLAVLASWCASSASGQYRPIGDPKVPFGRVASDPFGFQGAAGGKKGPKWDAQPGDLSYYSQILVQVERALENKDGSVMARTLLGLCPKELRNFEWYYLNRRANPTITKFVGHELSVRSIAFSPNKKALATGSTDETIKVWDFATGKATFTLKGHSDSVVCLAYHPTRNILASAALDADVMLWNPTTGKHLLTVSVHRRPICGLAFSPDGRWLASASGDGIHLLDLSNMTTHTQWQNSEGDLRSLAFSPDGGFLASASVDRTISVWAIPEFELQTKLVGHQDQILDLAFHPDNSRLISGGHDGLRIWDIATGKLIKSNTDAGEAPIYSLVCNRQGTTLATVGNEGKVKVWHEPFTSPARTFDTVSKKKSPIAFHPDGRVLAFGNARARPEVTVQDIGDESVMLKAAEPIWSIHAGNDRFLVATRKHAVAVDLMPDGSSRQTTLKGHSGQVRAICLQPQGYLIASAGLDRLVKIWDPSGTTEYHSLKGHKAIIRSLAFSPDGKHLASASDDKTIKIWDAVAGREVRTLEGHWDMVTSVVYLPGGQALASSSGDGTIRIWNLETGKNVDTWPAHEDGVSHLILSPDGKRLASAGQDRKIKTWDIASGEMLRVMKTSTGMVQSLAFSPDGKRLASGGSGNGVTLWDPNSGQAIYTFGRVAGPNQRRGLQPRWHDTQFRQLRWDGDAVESAADGLIASIAPHLAKGRWKIANCK